MTAMHAWPKTTPSGHVYEIPATYEDLCQRHADAAQAQIEGWDATEHPPEPTWEMVGLAHREIETLREIVRMIAEDFVIPSLVSKHDRAIARALGDRRNERPTYGSSPHST